MYRLVIDLESYKYYEVEKENKELKAKVEKVDLLEDELYNIEIYDGMDPLEILDSICESRKFMLKGNEYDYDRCCKAILTDFKQGRMGKITLEDVKDIKKLTKKTKVNSENN